MNNDVRKTELLGGIRAASILNLVATLDGTSVALASTVVAGRLSGSGLSPGDGSRDGGRGSVSVSMVIERCGRESRYSDWDGSSGPSGLGMGPVGVVSVRIRKRDGSRSGERK